jgi:glycosyltransferase involved in cell wall biosynthesis
MVDPDIIIAHYLGVPAYLAAATLRRPLAFGVWGSDIFIDVSKRYRRMATKLAIWRADIIFCNSYTAKDKLMELGAPEEKIRMIRHGVDTELFQRSEEWHSKRRRWDPAMVVSTRMLKPLYNVGMLVRAIPQVLREYGDTKFVIAGRGEELEGLDGMARSLGVQRAVQFAGLVDIKVLAGMMGRADIYVSTSTSDSASVSLLEAMACELAPVVTDIPANREWILDGVNGFLVKDEDMMARRIVHLIRNRELGREFGKIGREIVVERARFDVNMREAEGMCRGLIATHEER